MVAVACVDVSAGRSDPCDIIGGRNQLRVRKLRVRAIAPVGAVACGIASEEVIAHRFAEHPRQRGDCALERRVTALALPEVDGSI